MAASSTWLRTLRLKRKWPYSSPMILKPEENIWTFAMSMLQEQQYTISKRCSKESETSNIWSAEVDNHTNMSNPCMLFSSFSPSDFIKGNTKWTNSSTFFVWCLCLYVLLHTCVWVAQFWTSDLWKRLHTIIIVMKRGSNMLCICLRQSDRPEVTLCGWLDVQVSH